MKNIYKSFLFIILLSIPQSSWGMEADFFLVRTGIKVPAEEKVQTEDEHQVYAQYISKRCIIKYQDDIVYSRGAYEVLEQQIEERLKFLRVFADQHNKSQKSSAETGRKKDYPNFMTVILAATGKNKHNKFDRVFCNLYGEKSIDGTYSFDSEYDTSKFVVFYSDSNSGLDNILKSKDENGKEKPNPYPNNLFVRRDDLEEEEEKNQAILDRIKKSVTPSHTEPLSIAAIRSLKSDTFRAMLDEGYALSYYEIHFISYLDACDKCPKVIWENINILKDHFDNQNLFVFFHTNEPYEKAISSYDTTPPLLPYTLQYKTGEKWKYTRGRMGNYQYIYIKKEDNTPARQSQKYKLRGSDGIPLEFDSIPNFYFSFIYGLENDDTEHAARRIIIQ